MKTALISLGIILVLVGIAGAGGYYYISRTQDTSEILRTAVQNTEALNELAYDFGITLGMKTEYADFIFNDQIDGASLFGLGALDGPETTLENIIIKGALSGEVSFDTKEVVQTASISIENSKGDIISGEMDTIAVDEAVYVKVTQLPGFLSAFLGFVKDQWIVIDTSGFQASEGITQYDNSLQEFRDEAPTDIDEQKREQIVERFARLLEESKTQEPSKKDIIFGKEDLRYQFVMTNDSVKKYITDVTIILEEGDKPSFDFDAEDLDIFDTATITVVIDRQGNYVKNVFVTATPKQNQDNEANTLVSIESLLTLAPLEEPFSVTLPNDAITFEELVQQFTEKFFGGFGGLNGFGSPELPGDVSSVDTDLDGLTDVDELTVYGTDHTNADTDGDGYNDGDEVLNGYNPKGEGLLEDQVVLNPLLEARLKARDAKRVADIKQIQTALELYLIEGKEYPEALPGGRSANELGIDLMQISSRGFNDDTMPRSMFMGLIPRDPNEIPDNNPCTFDSVFPCNASYQKTGPISYELLFVLEGEVGDLKPGLNKATENGIISTPNNF